ncbi:hypothetical protein LINPERHAP2_LOCUS39484 [Linum perenne]
MLTSSCFLYLRRLSGLESMHGGGRTVLVVPRAWAYRISD